MHCWVGSIFKVGKSMKALFSAIAASAAMFGAAHAVVIDFESLSAGTIVDDEFAPLVTFSTVSNGSNNHAVVFDSANPTGNDSDLGAPFSDGAGAGGPLSPGKILIISDDKNGINCNATTCTPPDDEAAGGAITMDFSQEVTFNGFNVFDVSDGGASFTARFYDLNDALITTISSANGIGDNEYQAFSNLDITGVFKAVLQFRGSGAVDDLDFTVVPVPGALLLMLTGLGLGGFASRKRKTATA